MPRPARTLPDALGEAFLVREGVEHGVRRGRLRAQDLDAPFRGVRLRQLQGSDESDPDLEPLALDRLVRRAVLRRAGAYAKVMPHHAFFAGRTAAVVLGLPVEHGVDDDLCVAVRAPARPLRARGIHGVKLAPSQASVRDVEGLRVASPSSTWAMLAGELSVRELIIVGDAIVRVPRDAQGRARPEARLATIEQLRLAAAVPWRRERPKLEEALDQIRVGSMSPLETEFRLDAVADGLPEPLLDVEIRTSGGRLLGISDAVYPQQRTIVEVEGDHHRTTRRQWDRDIEKYATYAGEGWEVVRLTARHIRGRERSGISVVRGVLLRRGWRP